MWVFFFFNSVPLPFLKTILLTFSPVLRGKIFNAFLLLSLEPFNHNKSLQKRIPRINTNNVCVKLWLTQTSFCSILIARGSHPPPQKAFLKMSPKDLQAQIWGSKFLGLFGNRLISQASGRNAWTGSVLPLLKLWEHSWDW